MLSQGARYRDEIIAMGQYHTNPCEHPVRLVSVRWNQTWYYYLTNVLDPHVLSAAQVCDLYRRRWRIEDAFCLTKRLLGLAYLSRFTSPWKPFRLRWSFAVCITILKPVWIPPLSN